jgi:hypothetical protein
VKYYTFAVSQSNTDVTIFAQLFSGSAAIYVSTTTSQPGPGNNIWNSTSFVLPGFNTMGEMIGTYFLRVFGPSATKQQSSSGLLTLCDTHHLPFMGILCSDRPLCVFPVNVPVFHYIRLLVQSVHR